MFSCSGNLLFLFADDTNSFISSDSIDDLVVKANAVMDDIFAWCCCNKLSLNLNKTHFVISKPNEQFLKLYCDQKHKMVINGIVFQRMASIKFLVLLWMNNLLLITMFKKSYLVLNALFG